MNVMIQKDNGNVARLFRFFSAMGLCAAMMLPLVAYAAPECMAKTPNGIVNMGQQCDEKNGCCVTMELIESGEKPMMRITYDTGNVSDFYMEEGKAAVFEQAFHDKREYITWGTDAWRDDEYTRKLPKPAIPVFGLSLLHGKGKEAGEWTLFAQFVSQEGKLLEPMRAYIQQLKRYGYITDAEDKEFRVDDFIYSEKIPRDTTLFLSFDGKKQGHRARLSCTGGSYCALSLTDPKQTKREDKERAERKKKKETERAKKKAFDDDFWGYVTSPDGDTKK